MKRTALKRKTPLKSGGFLRRGTALRARGSSDVSETKERIQALLRDTVIITDGGCILRFYSEAGPCGGYTNAGDLILQAEHLVTRANSVSYGDLRNLVCLCRDHHLKFKPQHGRIYWELIERYVGPERWAWIKSVEADERAHKPHRFTLYDWQKIEMFLRTKLAAMQEGRVVE